MLIKKLYLVLCCCCVTAGAQETYTLTVNSSAGGTTSPSGAVTVQSGVPQSVVAYPDAGYRLFNWTVSTMNGTVRFANQKDSTSVTIQGDATIQANFVLKGTVYDIESTDRQYNYTTHNYTPTDIYHVPGVAFRFTAPAAEAYIIMIKAIDSTQAYLMDFGTDSTFTTYQSYVSGAQTLTQIFMATATGQTHYFSYLITNSAHSKNNFTIRYEPAAELTIEHSGFGLVYPSGKIAVRNDTAMVISAKPTSVISYFDHWEVVNGDATISDPNAAATLVTVNSGNAVVRAVFLMYPVDTLIVGSDANGMTFPVDTVFVLAGKDTSITTQPNGGYMFKEWMVTEGSATFSTTSDNRTTVSVSSGKARIQANFIVDPATKPSLAISDIDISGHPDICITASVTDTAGRSITGLDSSFFTLHEDGVSLPFYLSTVTKAGGMSVCLVLDKSGSMSSASMPDAIAAAQSYITTMNSFDRCAIVAFDNQSYLIHPMSNDKASLSAAVNGIKASGGTAILNGAGSGIDQLLQETNPRSVIIFSDGQGNGSISIDSVINHAIHNRVTIYSIGIGGAKTYPLQDIADATGGYYTYAPDAAQLAEIYAKIKRSVEARYILCYETPDLIFNGDTHSVVVAVKMNGGTSRDTVFWDESNRPPVITLTRETQAIISTSQPENAVLTITADVTDDGFVQQVKLFYRTTGSDVPYTESVMEHTSGDTYRMFLPAGSVVSPGIDFYILAVDNKNLVGKSPNVLSPESGPWVITVSGSGLSVHVISDTAVNEGNMLVVTVTATDFSGNPPLITATGLPAGAMFADSGNGTGLFSWNTGCNDHGRYTVTFTASNGTDSVTATLVITVYDVNFPPQFLPLGDTIVTESQGCTLVVKTTDCDGDLPHLEAVSIPPGSRFDDNGDGTGTLGWAPGSVDGGKYTAVFTASDNSSTVTDTVIIQVTDTVIPQTCALLTGGKYVDENGDGMVDAVFLTFDKKAPVDSMEVSFDWIGANVPHMGPFSGDFLRYGENDTIVRIAVPDASQKTNGIKTAGSMTARVRFFAFPDEYSTGNVADGAAPVIDSALCRVGISASGDKPIPDTLCVWFTESVLLGTTETPFTLINDTPAMRSPTLTLLSHQDNYAVYIIKDTDNPSTPRSGDSIFINPVSAVGDLLNWQNNADNRRVLLKWNLRSLVTLVPIKSEGNDPMDISVIASQLGIRETRGKIITLTTKWPFDTLMRNKRPVIDNKDGKPVFGTATIYDPVGNLVKSDALIKKTDVDRVYYILWDGINRNHRRVAPGSYLIRASVNIGKTPFRESKKLLIRWK